MSESPLSFVDPRSGGGDIGRFGVFDLPRGGRGGLVVFITVELDVVVNAKVDVDGSRR